MLFTTLRRRSHSRATDAPVILDPGRSFVFHDAAAGIARTCQHASRSSTGFDMTRITNHPGFRRISGLGDGRRKDPSTRMRLAALVAPARDDGGRMRLAALAAPARDDGGRMCLAALAAPARDGDALRVVRLRPWNVCTLWWLIPSPEPSSQSGNQPRKCVPGVDCLMATTVPDAGRFPASVGRA